MAFPTVGTTATTSDNDSASGWTENLPASIASGDLLIAIIACGGSTTALTWPANWLSLSATNFSSGAGRVEIRYKIATGAEGATMAITGGGGTVRIASAVYRITAASWHGTTPPEVGTAATGSSTAPNPPTVTASWGAADNLFIAAFGQYAHGDTVTAPTNYNNQLVGGESTGGTDPNSAKAYLCRRELASATDDPGTFSTADNQAWVAQTIVVRPVTATGRSFGFIF